MQSNDPASQLVQHSPEEKLQVATGMILLNLGIVDKAIDNLTSADLKRVLKSVGLVYLAKNAIQEEVKVKISEKEQFLIDCIFKLQEAVFGHQALRKEMDNADKVDITTTL